MARLASLLWLLLALAIWTSDESTNAAMGFAVSAPGTRPAARFSSGPSLTTLKPTSIKRGVELFSRPDEGSDAVLASEVEVSVAVDTPVEENRKEEPAAVSALGPGDETTNIINSVAALNAAAIGFFVLGASYELLHVDIEAALALFKFDDAMEASALATSIDLFLRLPMDSLHKYEELVPTNPVFYKACTSGVAYTIGDFVSQVYQGRTLETLDLKRSARSGIAGFVGHGPLCHYWMLFMETYLDFDGAWWGTGVKVIADQTVWSIYLNAMYSFLIGALAFRPVGEIWRDVKATSWPALRTSWRFWPFVHTISFSHAVPLDLKLLWVDVMEIVWVTLLSKVANDDKDKNLAMEVEKRSPSSEMEAMKEAVTLGEVEPAVGVAMTIEREQGGPTKSESLRRLEALMARADRGLDLAQLLSPRRTKLLAAKTWRAAWPLAAMWPFLFVGFQVETAINAAG